MLAVTVRFDGRGAVFTVQVQGGGAMALGPVFPVLMALRNLIEVAGRESRGRYPGLCRLPAAMGATVSDDWVRQVQAEARDYLGRHGTAVTGYTRSLLQRLDERSQPGPMSPRG